MAGDSLNFQIGLYTLQEGNDVNDSLLSLSSAATAATTAAHCNVDRGGSKDHLLFVNDAASEGTHFARMAFAQAYK